MIIETYILFGVLIAGSAIIVRQVKRDIRARFAQKGTFDYTVELATKHAEAGQLDHAADLLISAYEANPEDSWVCFSLGTTLFKLGRYVEAERYLELFIKRVPHSVAGWYAYSECLWKSGKIEQTKASLRRFMEEGKNHPDSAYKAALIWMDLQEYREARDLFSTALCGDYQLSDQLPVEAFLTNRGYLTPTMREEFAYALYSRAKCNAAIEEKDSAVSDLQRAIATEPSLKSQARYDEHLGPLFHALPDWAKIS